MLSKKQLHLLIYVFSIPFCSCILFSNVKNSNSQKIIYSYNKDINFYNIDEKMVQHSTNQAIFEADSILFEIINTQDSLRTFDNTLLKLDNLYNILSNTWSPLELLRLVHPNDKIRNKSSESIIVFQKYLTKLSTNRNLFNSIKSFSNQIEAKELPGNKMRFLNSELRDFKHSGLLLKNKKLNKLIELQNLNSELILKFEENIIKNNDTLFLEKKHLKGLPADYIESHIFDKNKYAINLSYPSYYPFMTYAESDSLRKLLHYKFYNRGMPQNKKLLKKILMNRKNIAQILGYESYADLIITNSMAKNKINVYEFEYDLLNKISQKAVKDRQELIDLKKSKYNSTDKSVEIHSWDKYFYENKLLINDYSVDSELVKKYFELDNVISGLFEISKILFDIQIIEVKNHSVWHNDVKMYKVLDNNKLIAKFYLDLFPRKNKYQHAAEFSLIAGKSFTSNYQLPISALVCNFPTPTSTQPSLLLHEDVETLFHEFGHLLHDILTTSELMSQSGTSVSSDFVEAPAQVFENWAWSKEALKLFAYNYRTGEIIPDDLLNQMILGREIQSGNNLLQQIFYGMLDLELHGDIKLNFLNSIYKVTLNLQNNITNYKYHKGTHLYASFDHLLDYGASYYGYLWSEVYACDMYSIFINGGELNSKIGMKFRKHILEKGDSQDPVIITEKFLGRGLENKAFLLKQGIN